MESDIRPEPDALLAAAAKEGRGRLKIFFGAAPGVGKTYAMLEAAKQKSAEGVDVVAGVVETHGRAETEALLRGIEVLPKRRQFYRDRILHEMDLESLIARRPQLALIDELAHTNIPDSRHEKRWQDVEDVLDAGIDVWTTLNVQHLETLNDRVARISGVRVRETVPDAILETADEIELIDLPTEELITRLRSGKVYVQDQIARAVQNFFSKGNLTALRELAMRAAADRVDAQLREHMQANAIGGPWPAQERIIVAINEGPVAKTLVRAAKRMAERSRVEWIALTVHSARTETLTEQEKDTIADALRLAEELGAELATLHASGSVVEEIVSYARRRNASRIVLGRPRARHFWEGVGRENVARLLAESAREFEVTLISEAKADAPPPRRPMFDFSRNPDFAPFLKSAGIVAVAGLVCYFVEAFLPLASLSLIFMTAVIVVAARYGLWPAIASSALSFLTYNFLFTEPRFTFVMARQDQILTLLLFFAASILTGNLAARLRQRAQSQQAIAEQTNFLYDFARQAAAAPSSEAVLRAGAAQVRAAFGCESVILVPSELPGRLRLAASDPPIESLDLREESAAEYAWEREEEAGRGSGTLPASRWLFLPVKSTGRRRAVLGIAYTDDRFFSPVDRRLLDALVDQIAIALERTELVQDLEESRVTAETERLRSALLSSVSHDLRTPLVSIIGAASLLADRSSPALESAKIDLAETIREEGERLDRYVQNLLDMTRLGYGALKLNRIPVDIREVVGNARNRLRSVLREHLVETALPMDLPTILADPLLVEQVLMNLLDNSAKYSPAGCTIRIGARVLGELLEVDVSDEGPGIPAESRERVFDMFYRVNSGDGQRAGTGLGLAIAKGVVEAHGGEIRAEAALPDGRGTRIVLALPIHELETGR